MNKKIISLVLALVMVLGTFTSVFAAETTDKAEAKKAEAGEKVEKVVGKDNKIQYVIDKKLVEGYEDGDYGLDKNIKRSEITRLLVLANGNEELAKQLQGSMKIYSDVDVKHWANGVISVGTTVPSDANGIAMLAGYPDGSFKPENDVTYAELAKMLVVLVKEDLTADMVKNATWATSWMTWAAQLGILDDVNVVDSDKAANRADAFTMVYNALYKMKEFKRVPANETRGIVSNLTNSKLTLNQDSDKEYTITGDTVIVDGINERKQIIKVNSLNDLTLYKGSLVRILTNDKNEVTHILELGNPEELALSENKEKNEYKVRYDNNVWEGVADATVKTFYYEDITTMKETEQEDINKSFAKIELKSDRTKADKITFYDDAQEKDVTLKINDDTEVYVANPYNDIMKEFKDINDALAKIGFHDYDGYKIPNVYAGFDTDDHTSAVEGFDSERNTAKVIVFNVVSKDNDGDRYRVINSSSSKFSTTLEDVDGKLYDRDNVLNKANFPLNYGDLLDVIEVHGDVIDKLLDHSDEKAFPVVRVVRTFDNNEIQVEDRFGNETLLHFDDADIFNADQYKDLEKGDYLQFTANNKDARDIEIVSILDDTKDTRDLFDKSGSVLNVVQGIEGNTAVGTVTKVNAKAYPYTVEIEIEEANWDKGLAKTTKVFEVSEEWAEALKVGQDVKFKVNFRDNERNDWAFNFVFNDGKDTPIVEEEEPTKTAIEKVEEAAKTGEVKEYQINTVKDEIKIETSVSKSKALQERLNKALEENAKNATANYVADALNTDFKFEKLEDSIAEANKALDALDNVNEELKAELNKEIVNANIVRYDYEAVTNKEDITVDKIEPAEVKEALETAIKAIETELEETPNVQSLKEVELTNGPKDNTNYADGAVVTAKATFEKGNAKLTADVTAKINVEAEAKLV